MCSISLSGGHTCWREMEKNGYSSQEANRIVVLRRVNIKETEAKHFQGILPELVLTCFLLLKWLKPQFTCSLKWIFICKSFLSSKSTAVISVFISRNHLPSSFNYSTCSCIFYLSRIHMVKVILHPSSLNYIHLFTMWIPIYILVIVKNVLLFCWF